MDFPEVDHNPLMDYPGSMSEILVCCLDTAPRASDQGEFEPSADFLCWLCPFTGRVSCSSAGGEGPQRKSPSLAKQQERCAERRRWEPLNPTSHPEPPRPQSPTGYQAHKTQLAFIRLLHGRLWTEPNHTFPLFPGIPTGSRKQVSIKLALPYHFHFCDRDSLSFWFIHSQMMALEKKTFRTQWKVDTWI